MTDQERNSAQYPTGEPFKTLAEAIALLNANPQYVLTIDEGQRQLLIMALALKASDARGFEEALWAIAKQVDETDRDRSMFNRFLKIYRPEVSDAAT